MGLGGGGGDPEGLEQLRDVRIGQLGDPGSLDHAAQDVFERPCNVGVTGDLPGDFDLETGCRHGASQVHPQQDRFRSPAATTTDHDESMFIPVEHLQTCEVVVVVSLEVVAGGGIRPTNQTSLHPVSLKIAVA